MTGTLTHVTPTMATVRTEQGDRVVPITVAAARTLAKCKGHRVSVSSTGLSGRFLRAARPEEKQ